MYSLSTGVGCDCITSSQMQADLVDVLFEFPCPFIACASLLAAVGAHNAIGTLGPNQSLYSFVDVISDCANGIARLPLGIGQGPIHCPQAGNERTCVPAPHRDEHRSCAGQFTSELSRLQSLRSMPVSRITSPPENTARNWQDIETALIDLSLCRGCVTVEISPFRARAV